MSVCQSAPRSSEAFSDDFPDISRRLITPLTIQALYSRTRIYVMRVTSSIATAVECNASVAIALTAPVPRPLLSNTDNGAWPRPPGAFSLCEAAREWKPRRVQRRIVAGAPSPSTAGCPVQPPIFVHLKRRRRVKRPSGSVAGKCKAAAGSCC